ncbi:MAG: ORF 73 extensive acidic domains, potential leucine zipper immediate early protein homolog [uncultured Sulfurovum sp.]|uniref:ORF 73 extensive acidic domains, potential leucine zipper immediate early protein homolog n=1 Tax=uncultured Sulfurovum sp. TaxID=269237 RepID=A0A6S6SVG6_9BACT|nr:MAG: ORF 73 extensive acidic domains, potential leucine zipper immediate early protein homolog [uncultured Sulfurovum sp.]
MDDNHDEIVPTIEAVSVNKKNNLDESEALIEASQKIVAKVDSELAECQVDITDAAEKFDTAKQHFKNVTLKSADGLLEKVGFEYVTFEEAEAFELSVDVSDEENFSVQTLNSGKFTGLILAILVALATVSAWVYLAMLKLNIDSSSMMNAETATSHVEPILTWISGGMMSANANIVLGALILGFSALLMAWLVYALRINMRGTKNLNIAKETFQKSNEYCVTQEASQLEMKKVDAHLREATVEVENLEMILNEQIYILKRILHVEGVFEEEKEYHLSSKKVMRETEKIMRATENLLETAITKERKLNFQSVQALNSAREVYAEYVTRIYD